jgi:hypothetical protein
MHSRAVRSVSLARMLTPARRPPMSAHGSHRDLAWAYAHAAAILYVTAQRQTHAMDAIFKSGAEKSA